MNINNPTTFGSPSLTFSTSNSSGTGGALRADDTVAIFSATVPETIAYGQSAAAGDDAYASRLDHVHGMAASDTTGIASQAEQEAGSSTSVATSPGRQQFHPSAPKAWCRITPAGALVAGDYNIASITDHAAGNRLIVFDIDFADALHVPVCGLVIDVNDFSERFENFAVGSVQQLMALGTTLTDCGTGSAHYGDQ